VHININDMKYIAFVEGRVKPQPRTTQKVKFLFGKSVKDWQVVDEMNLIKSRKGMLNKLGKPVKATRYAYRLERMLLMNEYRDKVFDAVNRACNGNIPDKNLFIFYLFHSPKTWSKKKTKLHEWQFHTYKPDYSNLLKGIEDCLYKQDSSCNAVANYKLYVPKEYKEGLLILQDEEIHRFVIDTAIDAFIKKPELSPVFVNING
jgi:Holliday junction resolvase RusA-like endonuclease